MSKILVVLGHPDSKSFNAEIFATFVKNLDSKKHEIRTLELNKMQFDPVLRFGYREHMQPDPDIENSQKLVKWADRIVFIYPIWWNSMPSLLKGWLDRVLTPGFSYKHVGLKMLPQLSGRTAELFLTSDGPAFYYAAFATTPLKLMKNYILGACGIRVKKIQILGNVRESTPEKREKWLMKIGKIAREEK